MKISPLQIQDLETMQDLSDEETSPLQGGLSFIPSDGRLDEDPLVPGLIYPFPRPRPFPYPWHPRPLPCTEFMTEHGPLKICPVIL